MPVFGADQKFRGNHATDHPEQVALPADPLSRRQDSPQEPAIDRRHDDTQQDLANVTGEDPSHQQVGKVPEHHAARPDVDFVRRTEDPHTEPTYERDDHRHRDQLAQSTQGDKYTQYRERHRIADEMTEPGMEKWGERDSAQPEQLVRSNPVGVEPMVHEEVDDLTDPLHGEKTNNPANPRLYMPEKRRARSRIGFGRKIRYRNGHSVRLNPIAIRRNPTWVRPLRVI